MFKKATRLAVGSVALSVIALLVLGPKRCLDLVTTQRERFRAQTAPFIDPAVQFRSAVQAAERTLPKQIADLKLGIEDTEKELATQLQALAELRDVLALVEKDLSALAPVVVDGDADGCDLHGKRYTLAEARDVAQRLLQKKRQYAELMAEREKLVQRLRDHRSRMHDQLVRSQAALSEFAENANHVRAKIALVQASEKTEALQRSLGNERLAGLSNSFAQLERRLDATLAEMEERTQLHQTVVTDSYVDQAREQNMIEELEHYLPGRPISEETHK